MTQLEREIIEYKADRILNIFKSENMADIPPPLFYRLANEFHVLTTILDNQSVDIKKR